MFYNVFKSSCTEDEQQLIQSVRMMEYVRLGYDQNGRAILIWDSAIGSVACFISEDGFFFSQTEYYKSSTGRMKGLVTTTDDTQNFALLQEEIENIKKMFRLYSQDAEVYFK
jgi:hypothetical protein